MTFQMPRATHEVPRHPLLWPPSRQRTPRHERLPKRWGHSVFESAKDLAEECRRANIHDFALSTGTEPGTRKIVDVGAVLWFMQRIGDQWVMSYYTSDAYREAGDNVKAIAMTIQRLRQIGDYGVYTTEQAMRGAAYEALPPPPAPPKNWWEVLGVAPTSPPVVVDAAYRALAQQRHPDKPGGSTEAMQELSAAYAEARAREA